MCVITDNKVFPPTWIFLRRVQCSVTIKMSTKIYNEFPLASGRAHYLIAVGHLDDV